MPTGADNKIVDILYLDVDNPTEAGRYPVANTVRKKVFWNESFKKNQFEYARIMDKGYRAYVVVAFEPALTKFVAGEVQIRDLDGNLFDVYDVNVFPSVGNWNPGGYKFYVKEIKSR
jgi:hypothetical protein